ncbi:Rcs stress response system protein RcsF [Shewanella sp. A14]
MTFPLKYVFFASGITLLLSACTSDFTFKSNLDSKVINDYFKVSDVHLYEGSEQPKGQFEVLGLVEGEACQETLQDAPPQMSIARTNARRAAADLGANGFVVKSCFIINEADNSCFSRALCVGQAIKVPTKQE